DPDVDTSTPAASSAPRTVGPSQPSDGCAATPVGLSITTMSSSWKTICISGTSTGTTCGSCFGVHSTSTQDPAATRSDLPTDAPSTRTPPSATTSAAKVREKPSIFARAASMRAPSSPSGTGRRRDSGIGGLRALGLLGLLLAAGSVEADADEHEQRDRDHAADDEDVGDIVDRGIRPEPHPRREDEVDDVSDAEARVAHEPVGEVAEHAAQQQAEHDGPEPRAHAQDREHDDAAGDEREGDREDPGYVLTQREGGARVEHEEPLQALAHHLDWLPLGEGREHVLFAQLIGGQHQDRENRDRDAGRRGRKRASSLHVVRAQSPTVDTGWLPEPDSGASRSASFCSK